MSRGALPGAPRGRLRPLRVHLGRGWRGAQLCDRGHDGSVEVGGLLADDRGGHPCHQRRYLGPPLHVIFGGHEDQPELARAASTRPRIPGSRPSTASGANSNTRPPKCRGQESNLHALRHPTLRRARLPLPPPQQSPPEWAPPGGTAEMALYHHAPVQASSPASLPGCAGSIHDGPPTEPYRTRWESARRPGRTTPEPSRPMKARAAWHLPIPHRPWAQAPRAVRSGTRPPARAG